MAREGNQRQPQTALTREMHSPRDGLAVARRGLQALAWPAAPASCGSHISPTLGEAALM